MSWDSTASTYITIIICFFSSSHYYGLKEYWTALRDMEKWDPGSGVADGSRSGKERFDKPEMVLPGKKKNNTGP